MDFYMFIDINNHFWYSLARPFRPYIDNTLRRRLWNRGRFWLYILSWICPYVKQKRLRFGKGLAFYPYTLSTDLYTCL